MFRPIRILFLNNMSMSNCFAMQHLQHYIILMHSIATQCTISFINKYKIHDRKLPKNMKISLKGSPWNNILIYSSLICGWIVWAKSLGFFKFLRPQEIRSRSKWMQNHKSLNQLCTAFWRRARLKLHKCGYLNAEEPVRVCMTHSMLISTEDYSRTNVLIKPFLMKIKIR